MAKASVERIDHVNIVVDDLDEMARFYREVLGMEQYKSVTINGEWVDRVVGLKEVLADVVFFRTGEGSNLELIKYRSPPGERPPYLAASNTHGIRHIAFLVNDIEHICEGIRRVGVELVSSIQDVPTDQFNVSNKVRKRLVYLHDPEHNLLELCSYEEY